MNSKFLQKARPEKGFSVMTFQNNWRPKGFKSQKEDVWRPRRQTQRGTCDCQKAHG